MSELIKSESTIEEFQCMQLPYKPIQITNTHILLEDGSIYRIKENGDFTEHYTHKAKSTLKTPKKLKEDKGYKDKGYTEEFEYMWSMWTKAIPNSSKKGSSFKKWEALNKDQRTALCYSIDTYSRTNENPQYLLQCQNYIKEKHWESLDQFEATVKVIIPPDGDPIWETKLHNSSSGITTSARNQINQFGMEVETAFRLINEKIDQTKKGSE
ncbi:unnamed protein product [marine sediment metagenome]|uniref:Uncharacterized protein n=1 Tax=marine sediment metagenome TaxID=412755 RepID=X0SGU5_9ZZZZ